MPSGLRPLFILLAVLAPAAAAAQSFGAPQTRYFKLTWQTSTAGGGRLVEGTIVNTYAAPAADVWLRLEGLDGAGRVVSTTVHRVSSLPSGTPTIFTVAVPPAAEYRVSVDWFTWLRGPRRRRRPAAA